MHGGKILSWPSDPCFCCSAIDSVRSLMDTCVVKKIWSDHCYTRCRPLHNQLGVPVMLGLRISDLPWHWAFRPLKFDHSWGRSAIALIERTLAAFFLFEARWFLKLSRWFQVIVIPSRTWYCSLLFALLWMWCHWFSAFGATRNSLHAARSKDIPKRSTWKRMNGSFSLQVAYRIEFWQVVSVLWPFFQVRNNFIQIQSVCGMRFGADEFLGGPGLLVLGGGEKHVWCVFGPESESRWWMTFAARSVLFTGCSWEHRGHLRPLQAQNSTQCQKQYRETQPSFQLSTLEVSLGLCLCHVYCKLGQGQAEYTKFCKEDICNVVVCSSNFLYNLKNHSINVHILEYSKCKPLQAQEKADIN